jgi:hypothetical protein
VSRFALVALLPEELAGRLDFVSHEFDTPEEIAVLLAELERKAPGWRALTIVHVEDLPLLMQPPG